MPKIKQLSEIVIDAFKAGKYPQGNFTDADLQQMADTYDPKIHQAPIQIGHSSDYTNDSRIPAFGWVGKVVKAGDHLKLVASEFSDQLKGLVKEGHYKKVSAAFYSPNEPSNPTPGKWYLHHLAFLGAQPPQVKGLEGIAFSEKDKTTFVTVDFDEEAVLDEVTDLATQDTYEELEEAFGMCLANVQQMISDGDGSAAKDQVYNELWKCYDSCSTILGQHFAFMDKKESILDGLKEKVSEMREKITAKFKNNTTSKETDSMAEDNALKAQITELSEKIKALELQKVEDEKTAKAELAKAEDARVKAQVASFMEELKTSGIGTKKLEELGVPAILEKMAKAGEVEFGEGKKQPALEILKATLKEIPAAPKGETDGIADDVKAFAEKKHINGRVDEKSLRVLMFAEQYIGKHPDEFKGLDERQANAVALQKILRGEIVVK